MSYTELSRFDLEACSGDQIIECRLPLPKISARNATCILALFLISPP
jgi:hypothetical protein